MVITKGRLPILVCAVFLVAVPVLAADDGMRCVQCGMDLHKYPHSVYAIEWQDGTVIKTCGVQCGLTQQLRKAGSFKKAHATDLITNRQFPVSEGFYVYKSSVVTDMGPGFISFKSRANAEKFQKGFGGQVVTHDEALKIWAKVKGMGP